MLFSIRIIQFSDMPLFYIGVDVGTGSVRAGLLTEKGTVIATAVQPITIKNIKPGYYEQSSSEVWQAVVGTIRSVVADSNVAVEDVKGVGFDATCSLVVQGLQGESLAVGETKDFDIIMWMDHR